MARVYGLESRGSIAGGARNFIFFTAFRPILGPNQFPMQWVLAGASQGLKWPQREAERQTPSSAKVKKSEAIPALLNKFSCRGA
jgi:hypothetical protein